MRTVWGLATCCWLIVAAAPGSCSAQEAEPSPPVSPAAELAAAAIRLPEGFSAAAAASEPNLANPVAFCFDPKGRIFVAETHRVHKGVEDNRHHLDWIDDDLAARTVADRRAYTVRHMGERIGEYTANSDLVRLLEDRDGDGRYEWSHIFSTGYNNVEDGCAAGVLWVGDRLLFTCIPSLWELRDADADGEAEQKRALATGFGVHFALFGHDLHGLTHGPDGKVYFSIGDRGLHVETPEAVLSNPDSGAVLRCNADGSDLELFATGLRNPQELAFNELGDLFTVDNNSDSGDRARVVYIPEGMQAGWRMSYQYLPDRGPFNREKIWHTQNDEQPASIVPPLLHLSDGPSGLAFYPGTGMPPGHEGAFFLCDFLGTAGTSGVRQFWVEPQGAGYRVARDAWFAQNVLATDCEFGPDGALYISDWVEGWSGTGTGRIHRVFHDDPAAVEQRAELQELLPKIAEMEAKALLPLLGHADMRVRLAAQRRLVALGSEQAAPLVRIATSSDSPPLARLHAMWAMGELGEPEPKWFETLAALCKDSDAEVRAQAAKTLGRAAKINESQRAGFSASLLPLLADQSPRVRAFAAISLGKLKHADALPALLQMARENADRDPVLRHAAAMGIAGSQTADALVAAAENAGEPERLAIVVALARQKSPRVAALLADGAERVRLEAARVIWDIPIPKAYGELAAIIDDAPSANEPLLRRTLAANVSQRTPEHFGRVLQCALRSDLSPAMREHAWELVRQWASPSPRDPVHGQWRPLEPRPAEEALAALRAALPKIVDSSATDATGLVVAAEMGLDEALAPMIDVVRSEAQPEAVRARAVTALGNADEATAAAAVEAGLNSEQSVVRSAARRVLVERFPDRAVEPLREAAEAGAMPERQAAIGMLARLAAPAARKAIAQWMTRVENDSCPPELVLDVLEAAAQSKDAALVERQKKFIAKAAAAGPMAAYAACISGGDPARGQKLFEENIALSCKRCHSTTPGETLVGPSLAEVGAQRSRTELLESLVAPNAKIVEGFQTTVMQLDTGKVVAGILRREDKNDAVLIDTDGKELVVDLAEVEDRFEGLSAMPEDLVKQMTPRDVRDLVEYLTTLRITGGDGAPPPKDGHGEDPTRGAGN